MRTRLLYCTVVFFIASFIFIYYRQLDIYFSSLFFDTHTNSFIGLKYEYLLKALYYILVIGSYTYCWKLVFQYGTGSRFKKFLYVVMSVIITVLFASFFTKAMFQRPRPIDIEIFGGTLNFTYALYAYGHCQIDCSFVSGHSASGFFLCGLAFLMPNKSKKRKRINAIAGILGLSFGLMRIAIGKHFLSDVIFAGVFMYCILSLLAYSMNFNI